MTAKNQTILKHIVENLKARFKETLISVVLFGSTTRDLSEKYSDIDLLVILKSFNQNPNQKSELEFELSWEWQKKFNKKIDLLILSRKDAVDNFEVHSPLFSTLALGVKIFYDKDQFFLKKFSSFLNRLKAQKFFYTDSVTTWDLSQKATDLLNSPKNLSEWLGTI